MAALKLNAIHKSMIYVGFFAGWGEFVGVRFLGKRSTQSCLATAGSGPTRSEDDIVVKMYVSIHKMKQLIGILHNGGRDFGNKNID